MQIQNRTLCVILRINLLLAGVLCLHNVCHAQFLDNLRYRKISILKDTTLIDSVSLVPGSFSMADSLGKAIENNQYKMDYFKALLIVPDHERICRSPVILKYRVLPLNFYERYKFREITHLSTQALTKPVYNWLDPLEKAGGIIKMEGLNKSGSIVRGVSFGNNQDLVVNSGFNLQMTGKLSQDLEIAASVTDNNLPLQPEGNTQQIQEFDKIFIRLTHHRTTLSVGDLELKNQEDYFLRYSRKLQGANILTHFYLDKGNTPQKGMKESEASLSATVSKGKFARNTIQGVESNQGPYRLKGVDNEPVIVVLSGSEKVYVDGELQTRGEDGDYVIDYNNAEVVFTPKMLITKDKRIVVEFEYSDKTYLRSLFTAATSLRTKKTEFKIRFFSEQDSKNQPYELELDERQKQFLASIGDSVQKALYSGADSVAFSIVKILYKKVDTLVNGSHYSTYVYSTSRDSAFYQLTFSYLGPNKGNYVLLNGNANGKVFKWLAPVNNIPQGSYEPVKLLPTPGKTQMGVIGMNYHLTEHAALDGELAVSNHDINTFSTIDKADNQGIALKTGFTGKKQLSSSSLTRPALNLGTVINLEFVGRHFSQVEPFRSVEFNRDWNLPSLLQLNDQKLVSAQLSLDEAERGRMAYQLKILDMGTGYQGLIHRLSLDGAGKGYATNLDASFLSTKAGTQRTEFLRTNGKYIRKLKLINLGLEEQTERNAFRVNGKDSLLPQSYSFIQWGAFLQNADSARSQFRFLYQQRNDYTPAGNNYSRVVRAHNIKLSLIRNNGPSGRLSVNGNYRILESKADVADSAGNDHTLTGNVSYYVSIHNGLLTSGTFYETGSGLEQKRGFTYFKVPDGQGIYTWIDYNGDGIPQLNEFEVSAFKEQAGYIRIFTPTNSYLKTYLLNFSEALNADLSRLHTGLSDLLRVVQKFSFQALFRIQQKTNFRTVLQNYNPLVFNNLYSDSAVFTRNNSFRGTAYFNRNHPVFGLDLSFQQTSNKLLLMNGFEQKDQKGLDGNVRLRLGSQCILQFKLEEGIRKNLSGYARDRNFHYEYKAAEPVVSFQPGNVYRFSLSLSYSERAGREEDDGRKERQLTGMKTGLECTYRIPEKGSLIARVNYLNISFDDIENTPFGFDILEGYHKGGNTTWSLGWQQNLSDYIQLSLSYDGRKSEGIKAVHTGNVQLRALF